MVFSLPTLYVNSIQAFLYFTPASGHVPLYSVFGTGEEEEEDGTGRMRDMECGWWAGAAEGKARFAGRHTHHTPSYLLLHTAHCHHLPHCHTPAHCPCPLHTDTPDILGVVAWWAGNMQDGRRKYTRHAPRVPPRREQAWVVGHDFLPLPLCVLLTSF